MFLCIFTATLINVYKYDKQKTDQTRPRWKNVKK